MSNNKVGAAELLKKAALDAAASKDKSKETSANATSSVEIAISCRKLANKDVLSKSDPQCVVYHKLQNGGNWIEILRTEVIQNNLNPDFAAKLKLDYRFEQAQYLKFEVYDIDSPKSQLNAEDMIGYMECTAANILAAGANGYEETLDSPDYSTSATYNGSIILVGEELAASKEEVFLRLSGSTIGSLLNACFPPKSFFTIAKSNESGTYVVVYRSVEVRGTNPLWPSVTMSGQSLCNGDRDRLLRIEIYKKNMKGEDDIIGTHFNSIKRMSAAKGGRIPLVGPKGEMLKTALSIHACTISPIFTFVDFIQAGTRIHLCFSVDFTTSNGDPSLPTSLHYISKDPTVTNPYEQAIEAAGDVIKHYDDTGVFPVFGFGAKIPPKSLVSHEFPVTLEETANCKGIDGVIRAYRSCVAKVQLAGPTNFAPVINRVALMASASRPGQHYYILVIITDGCITDLPLTKEAIVNASIFPLSIIIVGVGDEDFSSMEELDGDDGMVSHMGRNAERDIVQFVEYRSAQSWLQKAGGGYSNDEATISLARTQLGQEILAEIPTQLSNYMRYRGIEPSMITMEKAAPELVFAGPKGPNVTTTFDKMKQMVDNRKEAQRREEEERAREEELIKKQLNKQFNLFSLIGINKNKLWKRKPKSSTDQDQQSLEQPTDSNGFTDNSVLDKDPTLQLDHLGP